MADFPWQWMLLAEIAPAPKPGIGTMVALVIFIAASVWLGTLAQKVVSKGSFVKGFFLGNRGLGAWAVALTANVQSGGTFMGFPSLVYSHGWTVALSAIRLRWARRSASALLTPGSSRLA